LAFAIAITSFAVLAGREIAAAIISGTDTNCMMGVKSLIASYETFR